MIFCVFVDLGGGGRRQRTAFSFLSWGGNNNEKPKKNVKIEDRIEESRIQQWRIGESKRELIIKEKKRRKQRE